MLYKQIKAHARRDPGGDSHDSKRVRDCRTPPRR